MNTIMVLPQKPHQVLLSLVYRFVNSRRWNSLKKLVFSSSEDVDGEAPSDQSCPHSD
jgi:hypothetical protein